MNFRCLPHSHKFSVDKPPEIEGNWHWKGSLHCPSCGTDELEEVMVVSSGRVIDREAARRENRAMTQEAMAMAGRAKQESEAQDPTVRIADNHGTGGRFSGGVSIKKSTLDGLMEKANSGALDLPNEKDL